MLRRPAALLSLPLLLCSPALAVDGVLEINQTCASQSGCFPGDSAGFPVTIDGAAGRSYRLTSDLAVQDPNTDGLFLTGSRIHVDFNGFTLSGFSLGSGTGRGIAGGGTFGAFAGYATVRGGAIRGFRSWGIQLNGAEGVRVDDMLFEFNAGGGATLGDGAHITNSRFFDNGSSTDSCIVVLQGSSVLENVVRDCGAYGIAAFGGSRIAGNVVSECQSGILAGDGATVSGNTVHDNAIRGLYVSSGAAVLSDNASFRNGVGITLGDKGSTVSRNAVSENEGNGITSNGSSLFERNTVRENGTGGSGVGMQLFPGDGYHGNVLNANATGTVTGGNDLGSNVCDGLPSCP